MLTSIRVHRLFFVTMHGFWTLEQNGSLTTTENKDRGGVTITIQRKDEQEVEKNKTKEVVIDYLIM